MAVWRLVIPALLLGVMLSACGEAGEGVRSPTDAGQTVADATSATLGSEGGSAAFLESLENAAVPPLSDDVSVFLGEKYCDAATAGALDSQIGDELATNESDTVLAYLEAAAHLCPSQAAALATAASALRAENDAGDAATPTDSASGPTQEPQTGLAARPSPLWDGLWGALVSAVVGAVVAILVVQLTKRHERTLWARQQRIETFAEVLTAWRYCWDITERNWNHYESQTEHQPGYINTKACEELRDEDLVSAQERLRRAVAVWSIYAENKSSEITAAMDRAVQYLTMEWLYQSHQERGHLWIPMSPSDFDEWRRFEIALRNWHSLTKDPPQKSGKLFAEFWQAKPKTILDIMNDWPNSTRVSIE